MVKSQMYHSLDKMPAQYLKGVGPEIGKLLEKCQIKTVQDVLFHLPFRYQDKTKITSIRQARVGEWAVIEGSIVSMDFSKRRIKCEFSDNSGQIHLLFFHLTAQQKSKLFSGVRLRCYGEIKFSSFGISMMHPEYQIISDSHVVEIDQTLTPIYPSTEGLTQNRWRKISTQALLLLNYQNLPDYLNNLQGDFSDNIRSILSFSLHEALKLIHRPSPDIDMNLLINRQHPAQSRLAFEELLAHHLSLKLRREKLKQQFSPVLKIEKLQEYPQKFISELGFDLTVAQQRVIKEVLEDISQPHPMLRLVQGDVGCGKTVVAAIAALYAVLNDTQTAFMVPTELLSEQHYHQFIKWFKNFNVSIIWLNGKLKAVEKRKALEAIKTESRIIVIGTHALFQEQVDFKNLGLIIIDEQHRFGVEQRLALKQKGKMPHQLMMTATPIPRTLAMTCYADLNVSVIDELPPLRKPIKTVVISQSRRDEVIVRIRHAYESKRQIYWVCTLIEDSEVLQAQAAESAAENLKQYLPELNIQLIHGKLKSSEKENIMTAFKTGKVDLLIATTVIEVGVDVPNASVMIIENAERLGLAQLHQLRGRVGRGNQESYCILLYQAPLSSPAEERLRVIREFQDGFKIAEKDLSLRGPGELLGTRQTGMLNLRIADLARDQNLFESVQKCADLLLEKFPDRIYPLISRWVGAMEKFQEV